MRADDAEAKEAMEALERATCFYVYLLPHVMPRLAPFLLRAICRGARVLKLALAQQLADHLDDNVARADVLGAADSPSARRAGVEGPKRRVRGRSRCHGQTCAADSDARAGGVDSEGGVDLIVEAV